MSDGERRGGASSGNAASRGDDVGRNTSQWVGENILKQVDGIINSFSAVRSAWLVTNHGEKRVSTFRGACSGMPQYIQTTNWALLHEHCRSTA